MLPEIQYMVLGFKIVFSGETLLDIFCAVIKYLCKTKVLHIGVTALIENTVNAETNINFTCTCILVLVRLNDMKWVS